MERECQETAGQAKSGEFAHWLRSNLSLIWGLSFCGFCARAPSNGRQSIPSVEQARCPMKFVAFDAALLRARCRTNQRL